MFCLINVIYLALSIPTYVLCLLFCFEQQNIFFILMLSSKILDLVITAYNNVTKVTGLLGLCSVQSLFRIWL